MDEARLVQRCSKGDRRAMAELYTAHAPRVHALAFRFLRDPAEAEEVVQEVFLKAFRKIGGFRGEARLSTWLYQIALNACRSRRRGPVPVRGAPGPEGEEDLIAGIEDPRAEIPAEALAREELKERVRRVLAGLPEQYQEVLILALDRELSYAEVARATGRGEDEVRGLLYRGRLAFRKAFDEEGGA